MKSKYILLVLCVGVWLALDAFAWWPRAANNASQADFIAIYCNFSVGVALAQLLVSLLPLGGLRLTKPALLLALVVVLVSSAQLAFPTANDIWGNALVELVHFQVVALFPVASILRFLGVRLTNATSAPTLARQFTLAQLMQWTTAAAVYCLLVRYLNVTSEEYWRAVSIARLAVVLSLLVMATLWATLGQRGLLWRSALLIAFTIAAAVFLATGGSQYLSAWATAMLFASPTLLVWMTGVTLRAFGWRLVWQKSWATEPRAGNPPTDQVSRQ